MATRMRLAAVGGAGKIGSAILDGLLVSKFLTSGQVTVTARHAASLAEWRKRKVAAGTDNRAAVRGASVVLVCVHPDEIGGLLQEIGPVLTPKHLVISVVSGCTTKQIEEYGQHSLRVVRAMPNTPVMVRASMTCLAAGQHARAEDLELARRIFATVGAVECVDERHMNVATGLGGCGPAFVFKMIEALSAGGVKMGLPREIALRMAAQVLKGAAELVLVTKQHPAALKDAVTTPGGCTIDGLAKLEERGLTIALIDAVETATRKAGRLMNGEE